MEEEDEDEHSLHQMSTSKGPSHSLHDSMELEHEDVGAESVLDADHWDQPLREKPAQDSF